MLTAPRADFPAENDQLQTLRPMLRVLNATADQAGARTYEFQISDDPDFAPASASTLGRFYRVVSAQNNVAEGGDGKTQFEVPADLQPTTRFYWRARARQGTVDGPWSAAATFRTRIQGYNRAGELFDPLTNAQTVGSAGRQPDLHARPRRDHQHQRLARPLQPGADDHRRRVLVRSRGHPEQLARATRPR